MDKISEIRNKIERLHGNPYYMMAIKDVLSIIDSLQEEPTFDDFIQEGDEVTVNEDGSRFNRSTFSTNYSWIANILKRLGNGGDAQTTPSQMLYLSKWLREEINKEEPVSEDLEE